MIQNYNQRGIFLTQFEHFKEDREIPQFIANLLFIGINKDWDRTMKTTGQQTRIKPEYTNQIEVPPDFRHLLWDHPEGKAPLEKVIHRLLVYATIESIQWLMAHYPKATYQLIFKYPDIPRGAKFWVKTFYNDDR